MKQTQQQRVIGVLKSQGYISRRANITCGVCKKVTSVKPSRRNTAKYCTPKCSQIGSRGRVYPESGKQKLSLALKNVIRTPEHQANLLKAIRSNVRYGAESHNWRGGVTKPNLLFRNRKESKDWRKAVFERDNYTCVLCGIRSAKGVKVTLNADHIKPFAYYPELRLNLDNGRTLCYPCHKETDTYCGRAKQLV